MKTVLLLSMYLSFLGISHTSCLIVDDYTLYVSVSNKYECNISYNGNLIFAPATAAVKDGSFDKQKDQEMIYLADAILEEEGFTSCIYKGEGVFNVSTSIYRNSGSDYHFYSKELDYFSFMFINGTLEIRGCQLDEKTLDELKQNGIDMNGTLSIGCKRKAVVSSHNADRVISPNASMTTYEGTWISTPKHLI